MKLKELIHIIESAAPLSWQASWDNSGLQIGNKETEVSSVMLCTDVTPQIVDEAIKEGCQCVLTHHPLLFHPLRQITEHGSAIEEVVIKAIRAGISIYSSHTPMDQFSRGISYKMAERLGLENLRVLHTEGCENGHEYGYGFIGTLPKVSSAREVLECVKKQFGLDSVRYTPMVTNEIKTIALCGGAGAEFVEDAIRAGADVYISGDWKHHELLATQGRISIVDTGHWESEQFIKDIYRCLLQDSGLRILDAKGDKSPVAWG